MGVSLGRQAQVVGDQWACPVGVEVQRFLLRQQFFGWVRRGGWWQQVQFELGNRQVQRAWFRRRAGLRQWLAGGQDDRANPSAFEILLALLRDDFFLWEWRGGRWQQLGFEFGDGQEQWLRWGDLGVFDVALALGEDLRQQVGTGAGLYRRVRRCRRLGGERVRRFTELFGQRPGEEVLPDMTHPGQRLGIAQAVVVMGRQYTDG